jgi:hypothetical protein
MTTTTTPRDFFGRPDTSVVTIKRVVNEAQRLAIPVVEEFLSDLYNECGPDLGWAEKTPSLREMECVLFDLAASRGDTPLRIRIGLLTKAQRHAIVSRIR